ncbi:MAG: DUF1841 family protein [Firmicutes bacterium]|nr:DUF1841 family protein [Bacillota bacterium]
MFESLSRQELFLNIWRKREERHNLNEEERHFLKAMEDHPEMEKVWSSDSIYDSLNRKNEENPFAHIAFHSIVRNQIERNNPPAVKEAYDSLISQGASPHEAEHNLMIIMADELFSMLKEQRTFDEENYSKRIKKFIRN